MARVSKGSLIRLDGPSGANTADALVFQYNPEHLTRRVQTRDTGPPTETISCTLVFDATDVLGDADESHPYAAHGVAPSLAALELLTHGTPAEPSSFWDRLLGRTPASGAPPIVLFRWGPERAVPVRVTRLDIKELLHDPELRPLQASARLQMVVVSGDDVPIGSRAAIAWQAHKNSIGELGQLGYTDIPFDNGG